MGHNARKLTQVNKAHKDNSKRSAKNKKNPLVNITKKKLIDSSKELRILKADQHRKHSIKSNTESDYFKRGNNSSAPLLCGIFPLFEFKDIDVILSLLKGTDQDAVIKKVEHEDKLNSENFIMNSKKFKKNFAFTACKNFRDRFDYLDLAKIVDWCLFILPNDLDELVGDYTEDLLASLIAQGLPSSCFITLSNAKDFKLKDEVKYFEAITRLSLNEQRIQCLNNANDAQKLMRHLAENCKPSYVSTKKSSICSKSIQKKRGYLLIQKMQHCEAGNELRIFGCMRGFGMDLKQTKHFHVTELGDFPIKEVTWMGPEESNRNSNGAVLGGFRTVVIDHSDNQVVEEGAEEDAEDSEEEEDGSEGDSDDEDMDEESEEIADIGSEDSDSDKGDDKMSFATTAHSGFSVAQIAKFKESRETSMFPDEVDCPIGEKAREKFRKYRCLKGFKAAEWPLDENLPASYDAIHKFQRYKHERNRLANNLNHLDRDKLEDFVRPGSMVEIVLSGCDIEMMGKLATIRALNSDRHWVGSSLFPFEERVSVLHLNGRRLSGVDDGAVNELAKLAENLDNDSAMGLGQEAGCGLDNTGADLKPAAEPVESKETALFQIGFRRFASTPIYSEFTATSDLPGNQGKGKYCRFMELRKDVVTTVFGPVTYGPAGVLHFRIRQRDAGGLEGEGPPYVAELVATGSLLSIDPSKPIIKRVLLSGQIYKVHKRSVMVRYMFFNTEDVEHYKGCPLHTKSNKVGRILHTHGTHGYMRCHFDKPVTQDEVALMPLYKRVFPKFTVENMYDHMPTADQLETEEDADMEAMDMLF